MKKELPLPKYVLWIAYIGFAIVGLPAGTMNVAWRYIQADLNLPFSALGTLLIISSVGSLIVSSYSGSIIARLGLGRFLLGGAIFCLVGYVGFVLTTSWYMLVAAMILLGFGGSALINALNTFVATNFRSSHMNWLHASFGIGSTIGPIMVTLLVIDRQQSWQSAYVIVAAAYATLTILIFLTRHVWTVPQETQEQTHSKAVSMRETLRLPAVWIAIGLFFFATGTEIGTSQLTNTLFVDGRGYDARMVATWISLYWLFFTAARALTGLFIDKVDYRIFLRFCMVGTGLGAVLIWSNVSPTTSFIGLLLMSLTMAPIAPTLFANTPQQFGMNHAINAIGFLNTGAGLGLAFPPAFASRVSEWVGLEFIPLFLIGLTIITFVLYEWFLQRLKLNQKRGQP
jgi:fucose permease